MAESWTREQLSRENTPGVGGQELADERIHRLLWGISMSRDRNRESTAAAWDTGILCKVPPIRANAVARIEHVLERELRRTGGLSPALVAEIRVFVRTGPMVFCHGMIRPAFWTRKGCPPKPVSPITERRCTLQSRKPASRPVSAAMDSPHAGSFPSSFWADMQTAILGFHPSSHGARRTEGGTAAARGSPAKVPPTPVHHRRGIIQRSVAKPQTMPAGRTPIRQSSPTIHFMHLASGGQPQT